MPYPRLVKAPCVYILASKRHGVLYIGVTSDLHGRMADHALARSLTGQPTVLGRMDELRV